jgi:hypothetical protein
VWSLRRRGIWVEAFMSVPCWRTVGRCCLGDPERLSFA